MPETKISDASAYILCINCQIIEGYGRYSYNWDSCLYDVINDNRASSIIELYGRTKSFSSLLHLY